MRGTVGIQSRRIVSIASKLWSFKEFSLVTTTNAEQSRPIAANHFCLRRVSDSGPVGLDDSDAVAASNRPAANPVCMSGQSKSPSCKSLSDGSNAINGTLIGSSIASLGSLFVEDNSCPLYCLAASSGSSDNGSGACPNKLVTKFCSGSSSESWSFHLCGNHSTNRCVPD